MLWLTLSLLAFLSLFPNLSSFPLWMEESRRAIVSYEMWFFESFFQPTLLGEPYFNKPPLFNWFVMLSSKLLGWDTFSPRAVTLFFLALNYLAVVAFSFYLFKNLRLALFAGLVFLSFSDVLFWYGWLAEIDITLTFFVFLGFVLFFLLYKTGSPVWLYVASFLFALVFMLKGFPAFAFWALSLLSVFALNIELIRVGMLKHLFLAFALLLICSLWWIPLSEYPLQYLTTLWSESFSRVESSASISDLIKHAFTYPLLNFKQLLPVSFLALIYLITSKFRPSIKLSADIKFFGVLLFLNYLPYLLSASARGRYVLPLFPLVAVLLSYTIFPKLKNSRKFFKITVALVAFFIAGRFLYGFVGLPLVEERKGNPKRVAQDIVSLVKGSKLSCDCARLRDVCFYAGVLKGEPLLKSKYVDTPYVIDCRKREGLTTVKAYKLGKRDVFLLRQGSYN